jgi:hypothetical protein
VTEVTSVINLVWFTESSDGVVGVAFNFAALAVVAEFDEALMALLDGSQVMLFAEGSIPFER